jgi:2-keto-4-pentenoate hydratase/2-oxohepta-3-ene-1,7-dioic acid hydratase (catechol pathway)
MKFLSFVRENTPSFGASSSEDLVVDLGARLGCADLGDALRRFGRDYLCDLALRGAADFRLTDIDRWRPVVSDPRCIACVGLNYEEHRVEAGRPQTVHPTVFLRLPSSQVGHLQPIVVPAEAPGGLDYEGEIAVIIGRQGRRIRPEQAWEHVLGLACYNDSSAREWQSHSTQWSPGKNFPGTGAFGPWLVTTDEIAETQRLALSTRLNGQLLQQADTSMMIFPIPELVAYISTFTELYPGDVIVTGTPGGVGFKRNPPLLMKPGDVVEVEVEQVGVLRNPIAAESTADAATSSESR